MCPAHELPLHYAPQQVHHTASHRRTTKSAASNSSSASKNRPLLISSTSPPTALALPHFFPIHTSHPSHPHTNPRIPTLTLSTHAILRIPTIPLALVLAPQTLRVHTLPHHPVGLHLVMHLLIRPGPSLPPPYHRWTHPDPDFPRQVSPRCRDAVGLPDLQYRGVAGKDTAFGQI